MVGDEAEDWLWDGHWTRSISIIDCHVICITTPLPSSGGIPRFRAPLCSPLVSALDAAHSVRVDILFERGRGVSETPYMGS